VLVTALAALAALALMTYAWFTSTADPVSVSASTATIKVRTENTTLDMSNVLPGDSKTLNDVKLINESTRNAVTRIQFNEDVSIKADYGVFLDSVNAGGYPTDIQTFANNMAELASQASNADYYGEAYISSEKSPKLVDAFYGMATDSKLLINQDVADFLKICKDNNLGVSNDQVYNFNSNPLCVAYANKAAKVQTGFASLFKNAIKDAFDGAGLDHAEIGSAYYVAFPVGDGGATFDLKLDIPTSWGNEFMGLTASGMGISVDAVQGTKAAVKDVFGLTDAQVGQIATGLSDFWSD
jgi:hypothetical protein